MDKKKNAVFRAKLEERKKNQVKRIDHPLLRYNEKDQPVCKVCDLLLKSDSHWDAHQVSAKHHQAVKNLKANAAKVTQASNVKAKQQSQLQEPKIESADASHSHAADTKKSVILEQRPSHALPTDFFDNSKEAKKQKTGNASSSIQTSMGPPTDRIPAQPEAPSTNAVDTTPTPAPAPSGGALPAGFFDNKDADLRARGIEPVKPNVNDEYKEFEKLIQDDLQEVDNRLEEEEIDAADSIEIAETLEQQAYREKVERLKNLKKKVQEAKSSAAKKEHPPIKKSVYQESSSDSDGDYDDSTVDWRAQHL